MTAPTRRTALGLAAAAGAAALARPARAATAKTYVLVHGTWHGGWMWRDVANRLRAEGHIVFTPTCTGCGERNHLISPEIGLDTHIQDIASVIETEELDDVILIGHSFGGITITGVADRLRDRIRRIVYFDALVPDPTAGRMSGVTREADGSMPEWWLKRQEKFIDGHAMNFYDFYPMEMLVPIERTDLIDWLKRRITTHPARQWSDELVLANGGWDGLPRTYIHADGQVYSKTSDRMIGPARGPGWDFVALPVARNGMMSEPEIVATAFAALA